MIIGLAYLLVLASVPLARGRITALADLKLRRPGLAIGAIALQVLVISIIPTGDDHTFHTTAHMASYFLLGAFAWSNRRVVGVPIIALGGFCNFLAIAANGGVMPADPDAIASLYKQVGEGEFANSQVLEDPKLSLPLHNVFSIGDGILLIGVFVLVHAACGSRIIPRRFQGRPAAVA
jgi:hypothetical protein